MKKPKETREGFSLDYTKLKAEDRRFLMNFFTNQTTWNANNMMVTLTIYFSLMAILISAFSLLYSTRGSFDVVTQIVGIFFVVIFLIAAYLQKRYKSFFHSLGKNADNHYKKLYEIHYKYAGKDDK